mmetsp:Transcript_1002/g.3039  ORF Transcript_1002/g.3039 Transcript_1002/m.3039 type:complete len:313 (-) Transcript_1002:2063-3001(-)
MENKAHHRSFVVGCSSTMQRHAITELAARDDLCGRLLGHVCSVNLWRNKPALDTRALVGILLPRLVTDSLLEHPPLLLLEPPGHPLLASEVIGHLQGGRRPGSRAPGHTSPATWGHVLIVRLGIVALPLVGICEVRLAVAVIRGARSLHGRRGGPHGDGRLDRHGALGPHREGRHGRVVLHIVLVALHDEIRKRVGDELTERRHRRHGLGDGKVQVHQVERQRVPRATHLLRLSLHETVKVSQLEHVQGREGIARWEHQARDAVILGRHLWHDRDIVAVKAQIQVTAAVKVVVVHSKRRRWISRWYWVSVLL